MLISISHAAQILGVCNKTPRRWHTRGVIVPYRTEGGHRRYDLDGILHYLNHRVYRPSNPEKTGKAAIYCRVSSPKQKDDLERQKLFLKDKAEGEGYTVAVYQDIGSGLNDKRKNFLRLIEDAVLRKFDKLYVSYLDRLARFGTLPLRKMMELRGITVEVCHSQEGNDPQKQLVDDLIALMHSFSGKMYRMRRGKNTVFV